MKRRNYILAGCFIAVIAAVALWPRTNKQAMPGQKGPQSGSEAVRITTAQAEKRDLQSYIRINGDVEADNTVEVYPDIAGKLIRLHVSLGTKVNKGDLIAEVDPSKPGAAYAASPILAPISGTITSVPLKAGATVTTGTAVALIGDIRNLQITAKIPERDVGVLTAGLTAELSFEAYPEETFTASVYRVSPVVDSVSRTKEIFLSFTEEDNRVNAGMFAKIKLYTTLKKNRVTVPEEAIQDKDGSPCVYVISTNNTASLRKIEKGITVDGIVEITSGLEAGETVAVQGASSLTDGAAVTVAGGAQ
jgi:multidrug efflux pump subunit AcrA (membrane-fusion protein)